MDSEGVIVDILSKQFTSHPETDCSFSSFIRRERFSDETCFPKLQFEIVCKRYKIPGSPVWSEWKTLNEFENLDQTLRKIYPSLFSSAKFPRRPAQNWALSLFGLESCIPEDLSFNAKLKHYWEYLMSLDQLVDFDSDSCSTVIKSFLNVQLHENLALHTTITMRNDQLVHHKKHRSESVPIRKSASCRSSRASCPDVKLNVRFSIEHSHSSEDSLTDACFDSGIENHVPVVGSDVLAFWDGMWFVATIESIIGNTLDVVYEDGMKAEGLVIGKDVLLWDSSKDLFPSGRKVAVINSKNRGVKHGTVLNSLGCRKYLIEFGDGNKEIVFSLNLAFLAPPL